MYMYGSYYFFKIFLDDSCRIVLEPVPNLEHDYINASYIDVSFQKKTSSCIVKAYYKLYCYLYRDTQSQISILQPKVNYERAYNNSL